MSCRYECECPSDLHHDLMTLLEELNAPIKRSTLAHTITRIEQILEDDKAREEEDA